MGSPSSPGRSPGHRPALSWTSDTLGGSYAEATAVNQSGLVVGYAFVADQFGVGSQGFVWTAETPMRGIGTLGGPDSRAEAVNASGHVVGWSNDSSFKALAFLWTPETGMRPIADLGAFFTVATKINDHGQVIGFGFLPNDTQFTHSAGRKRAVSAGSKLLGASDPLHAWLGLKTSDDIGTRFDLRAEILKNGVLVGSGEVACITGVARNPAQAVEVSVPFGPFSPTSFNGTADVLSARLLARIGTTDSRGFCGSHSNAAGLRLYFDAISRPSRFDVRFVD
jgi:probable HAF family extracellular repeat protein